MIKTATVGDRVTWADLAALRAELAELRTLVADLAEADRDPDDEAFVAVAAGCVPPGIEFTSRGLADSTLPEIHAACARYRLRTAAQIAVALRQCDGMRVGDVRLVAGPRGRHGRRWSFAPVTA